MLRKKRSVIYTTHMNILWIPEFKSTSTNLYDSVAEAQQCVDRAEAAYRTKLAKRFAELFTRQVAHASPSELRLTADLVFLKHPCPIVTQETIGIIGKLAAVSYCQPHTSNPVSLSLDIAATQLFDAHEPDTKQPYTHVVTTPLRHVKYIEHELME